MTDSMPLRGTAVYAARQGISHGTSGSTGPGGPSTIVGTEVSWVRTFGDATGVLQRGRDVTFDPKSNTLVTTVHRGPQPTRYASVESKQPNERIEPSLAPSLAVTLGTLDLG